MSSTSANTPRIIAAQRAGVATTTQAGTTAIPHQHQQHAVPDDTDPQRQAQPISFEPPPSYEHMDMTNMDFGAAFGESPAISLESMDAGFSPEVTHDIGWDWVDFTQLFPETL